jgi:hypothetical protein
MVGLDHDRAELRLRIADSGVGFDQAEAKTFAGPWACPQEDTNRSYREEALRSGPSAQCGTLIAAPTSSG